MSGTDPVATRPHMPGYGLVGPEEGSGLLTWTWARERLERSHDYWLATSWPDGRPHVMPVWGLWVDDTLWFSCSPGSRKACNLAADPRCVATTDDAQEPVIVEGVADRLDDEAATARFADLVSSKYATEITVEFLRANLCFRIRPVWAFGLDERDFTGSPTRWRWSG